MDPDAFATGHGTATTGHGYPVPADLAKTWASAEARVIAALLSGTKGITGYSTTQLPRHRTHRRNEMRDRPG